MSETIVVVTNGSAEGRAAVGRAGAVALERDAVVHVVAIVEDVVRWALMHRRVDIPEDFADCEPEAQVDAVLEQAAQELMAMGVFVQRHKRRGPVGEAVVRVVTEHDATELFVPVTIALEVMAHGRPCPVHVVGNHGEPVEPTQPWRAPGDVAMAAASAVVAALHHSNGLGIA
jgi:nucleotide-binding universal stress UspA family protein